jgi:hypothetical protein
MLRESRARWLAFATAGVVVALAALFAWLRNAPGETGLAGAPQGAASAPAAPSDTASSPQAGPATPRALPVDAARLATGRAAFTRLGCVRCHAFEGVGNPSLPLDGVGARLDAAAVRDWALGTGAAAEELGRGTVRAKSSAAEDPDLDALVEVLADSR